MRTAALFVVMALPLAACTRAEAPRPPAGQVHVVQNGLGRGEVRVGLAKDGCGLDCPELLGRGAAARLLARPAEGSLFDGFSGPCTGRMPCVVPLDKLHWVAASFRDAAARYVVRMGEGRGHVGPRAFGLDAGGGLAVAGATEVWLGRYNRDGKKLWDLEGGGTKAEAIATAAAGDAVVAGRNDEGALVEQRGAAGNPIWKQVFQGDARATDIVLDDAGDALVCGTFAGALKLGKTRLESAGGLDVFVLRLDKDGKLLDAVKLGGKGDDRAPRIATDGAASVFVAYTTADADSSGNVSEGAAHVAHFSSFGHLEWEKEIAGRARIDSLASKPPKRGDVVLAGRFVGTIDAFGKTLQSSGARDALVVSLDASGAAAWARSFGGKDDDEAGAVAVDERGRIALLGTFQHSMRMGTTTLDCQQFPQVWYEGKTFAWKGVDVFLGVLSPDGEVLSAKPFGGTGTEFAGAVAWAPGGDVVMLVEQEELVIGAEGGVASVRERIVMRRPTDAPPH